MEYPFIAFQLCPSLQFHDRPREYTGPADIATTALMSFAQLLRLIGVPTELVPSALHHRVQFCDVAATLIVQSSNGLAFCMTGKAACGPSRRDELLFFNRLAPATSAPAHSESDENAQFDYQRANMVRSPVNRWLRLQCRPVLDPAVFPELATLTQGRCMEPLYQYVLCETQDDGELSDEQRNLFEDAHCLITAHDQHRYHPVYPLRLRPTNAVHALQPHLSSGYLELPTAALTIPLSTPPPDPAFTTSSASSSFSPFPSSAPLRAFLQLSAGTSELFCLCLDYLDSNSVLFGLLPVVHSLPAVTAALSARKYWPRALLSRFGRWSDAALWTEEVLSAWRRHSLDQRKAEERDIHQYSDDREKIAEERIRQLGAQEATAHRHEVHCAALLDLQTRVNKFLIGVMLQRKEDVLPQSFGRPHHLPQHSHVSASVRPGTVRPTYSTIPTAAMELLMCVPPFHSVPYRVRDLAVTTYRESVLGLQAINNASPHHMDFAGFMSRRGNSSGSSVWALYMGPVYAYEDHYTAARGHEVDRSVLESRRDQRGNLFIDERRGRGLMKDRAIRQLFIEDVDQLPVTQRMPFGETDDLRLYAPTLAACFRAKGVTARIEKLRAHWRRVVEKHAAVETKAEEKQKVRKGRYDMFEEVEGDGEEEREEKREEAEEDEEDGDDEDYEEDEEERWDMGNDSAMDDREGCMLQYVEPLMESSFESMHFAMWEQPSWTAQVAERALLAARSS